ncbi:MAG: methylmalonyl-CoA decarboxylase [Candidatus Aminicenantes bacterium]|nr:methylmalonyl-CoA decarboxylase [Candidatus Aminicenantes bacterium]
MPFILTARESGIGTIILNRPEKRNSFSAAMLDEFIAALNAFKADGARAVVLRAEKGAKIWSAGLDIGELPTPGKDPLAYNHPIEVALRAVQHLPAPVIAMVEGGVWGAACDLCLTCDILVGAPSASFAITPAKIGVPYNSSGILHFLNVAGLRVAKEMFFTAAPVGAERALDVGILNHLVPAEDLERFTYDMARKIAENSPLAISVIKEQLRLLAGSFPLNPETFEKIQALREKAYDSADYVEGTRSFFERRKPEFTGK